MKHPIITRLDSQTVLPKQAFLRNMAVRRVFWNILCLFVHPPASRMAKSRRADSRLRLPTSAVYYLNSLNGQLFLIYTPHTPCLSGRRCTVGWLCALCRYSVPSSSERRQGPLWRFLKESAPSAQADLMYHAEPPLRRGRSARLSHCYRERAARRQSVRHRHKAAGQEHGTSMN